jgi:hypothetical protein
MINVRDKMLENQQLRYLYSQGDFLSSNACNLSLTATDFSMALMKALNRSSPSSNKRWSSNTYSASRPTALSTTSVRDFDSTLAAISISSRCDAFARIVMGVFFRAFYSHISFSACFFDCYHWKYVIG